MGADSPTDGNAQIKILTLKKLTANCTNFHKFLFYAFLHFKFWKSFRQLGNNLCKFVKFVAKKHKTVCSEQIRHFTSKHSKLLIIFAPLYSII
ncbi:hypothetical protein EAH81_24000 [Flavobacterium pectinovorum]|uniref:Uncharacterized protein n=1 Tax=Flavobacterium pectinovorum TaxID=29533 RepID=A0A502E6U6_9FLAO|nr:hypothetical protein EAH81_24000 [Flavobacterium pectinovorum]